MKPITASIVIPSYNGRPLLERYLGSVVRMAEEESGNHEIIVVDDGGSDDTAVFLREHYPEVQLLALTRNGGFQRTCNWGARVAKGEIIVFLNNDMEVQPGFLAPLLRHFTDEQVFAVSARSLISRERQVPANESVSYAWWEQGTFRVRQLVTDKQSEIESNSRSIAYAFGGASAVDRGKFLAIGGFDDLYAPWTVEDIDLSYRAWKRNWRILYEPTSVVHHQHHATLDHFRARYRREISARNFLLFTWKNITSRRLFLSHLIWLPWWQITHLLHGRTAYTLGLLRALVHIGQAWRGRRREALAQIVTDEEVLARIAATATAWSRSQEDIWGALR